MDNRWNNIATVVYGLTDLRLVESRAHFSSHFFIESSQKPSENSGFHPFCKEKSPDSSTSHPMKNARRTDRLDDP